MHHRKSDTHKPYLSLKKGSKGVTQLEVTDEITTIELYVYIQSNTDWMVQLVRQHKACKKLLCSRSQRRHNVEAKA